MCKRKNKNAFTLIEVLVALLLVSLAIISIITANISSTKINAASADMTTAEFLIEQISQLTTMLPAVDPNTGTSTFGPEAGETLAAFDDIDDFSSLTFNPPIASDRSTLTALGNFTQQVTVENVNASDYETTVGNHLSDFYRITVTILQNSKEINSASWIRAKL